MNPKSGQIITASNFGAWLIKCNPKEWDLAGALDDGLPEIIQWSVADNYRSESIQAGDDIVFWVSGTSRKALLPGVWGVGKVTSERYWVDEEEQLTESYWLDEEKGAKPGYSIDTDIRLITDENYRQRVSRDSLKGLRAFESMEVLRQTQGSNPSFLTKAEFKALEKLLNRRSILTTKKEPVVTVRKGGAGFGSPEQNAMVEARAMSVVLKDLKKKKFRTLDVSSQNLGWDITATKSSSKEIRHIEVKGVSGNSPKILLTNNEMSKAVSNPNWELAIVTDALSAKPKLERFTAASVTSVGKPWVWQVDLS
jgi:hypothetical protein